VVYLVEAKISGKCGKPGFGAIQQIPQPSTMEKFKYNDLH
jgi:hypothetical protein